MEDKRLLGLILARGGSKRLARKNVLPLAGKPMIAWTIDAARSSRYIDRLVLSSEDDEIIEVAGRYGCEVPFKRPAHLAADDTPAVEPVIHALDRLPDFDFVMLLQPTSPLRATADIDGAVELLMMERATSCVSVARATKPPQWMFTLDDRGVLQPAVPSPQALPSPVYVLNGAIYLSAVDTLRKTRQFVTESTVAYRMPGERSVDVDTALDLLWCEFLLDGIRQRHGALLDRQASDA